MPTKPTIICAVCRSKRRSGKSSSVQERAQLNLNNQCYTVVLHVQFWSYYISMAWQSVAEPWLNHGEYMYMLAGQWALRLLQDLFKQGKLSLTLTLTWGNCKGSCNNYNWDSWAPSTALHASRNVAQRLKRLETIQMIEHSAVVNSCQKDANNCCWSQVISQ